MLRFIKDLKTRIKSYSKDYDRYYYCVYDEQGVVLTPPFYHKFLWMLNYVIADTIVYYSDEEFPKALWIPGLVASLMEKLDKIFKFKCRIYGRVLID